MLRVGFLGVAHMHSYGYAHGLRVHPRAEGVGVWDADPAKATAFSTSQNMPVFESPEALFEVCDAVILTSENVHHAPLGIRAAQAGKAILCEKPLVTSVADGQAFLAAAKDVPLMTAFPCRYSPAFLRLKERVRAGDLGAIRAICATNRGRCPFGWFVDPALSGGGAMIDHVVHVTDLLRALLRSEVVRVQAQTGHQMYAQEWDDTAMLTLEFANGVFATLDSSWSRHANYKTWGDVTMRVVGESGVAEMDMFGQEVDFYSASGHAVAGFGSDLDAGLVDDFVTCVLEGRPVPITGEDGLAAAQVALAGYESVQTRAVVTLPA